MDIKMKFRQGYLPLPADMPEIGKRKAMLNVLLGDISLQINQSNGFIEFYKEAENMEFTAVSDDIKTRDLMTARLAKITNSLKDLNWRDV